jgi:glycosyltransferase involved in cell wall biosynthesis
MNTPLVSVVMPVYNQEKYVAAALESVLNQTYTNLEILVGDDASKDRSLAIIRAYAAKDNRIKVLSAESNLGICGNFNRLFDSVTGEYVAFFSGDDIMMPNKIATQLDILENNKDIVVVHHDAWIIDDTNNRIRKHRDKHLPLYNPLDWALKADWFHSKRIAPLLPTTCLARTGYYLYARYDKRFKYKHELLFTIEDYCNDPKGKWQYIDEPMIEYRHHENNFTNNALFRQHLDTEKFLLHDAAKEKCSVLNHRLKEYKLFVIYETLLFKFYGSDAEVIELKKYYNDHAFLFQKLLLRLSMMLNRMNIYWAASKYVHYMYRPFYSLKYKIYNFNI